MTTTTSLYTGFHRATERFASRPALVVEGDRVSYGELAEQVARLSGAIAAGVRSDAQLVGLLANRSRTAYAGALAVLASGRGYVPLNPKHPVDRLRKVLTLSEVDVVIAGREGYAGLRELLVGSARPLTVVLPDAGPGDFTAPPTMQPHRFVTAAELARQAPLSPVPSVDRDVLAYLLFTSGSTGEPKGVAVTHANVRAYAAALCDHFQVNEHDRFSQMSDLSFDWSVHDLYVCWEGGACLVSIPEASHLAPAKLIRAERLTMWASVPSTVGVMLSMRMLKPGAFPALRGSVFCGEPLPAVSADAWQRAAPQSIVENLYGPTETTVAITRYRWQAATSPAQCQGGIVPIGWMFPGQRGCVVDSGLAPVPAGTPGELCLAGSQVALGYWKDPGETARRFVTVPGLGDTRWYRTGDLVREGEDGCLYYLGRLDDQVKIRGYRVELQEIDHAVRQASGADLVMSVAWPIRDGSADGVVTFVSGARERSPEPILAACRRALPEYMVPREICYLDAMPLSPNGKIDRRRLVQTLEERKG